MAVCQLLELAADYNPRKIDRQQLAALRRSLRTFGAVQPVVLNRRAHARGWPKLSTPVIVGGHQRVAAAGLEGMEHLPVVWVDLDQAGEQELNLALNRISGQWEGGKLREVLEGLEQLSGADLGLTGFSDQELQVWLPEHGQVAAEDPGPGAPGAEPPAAVPELGVFGGGTAMARGSAPLRAWRKAGLLEEPVLDFGAGHEGHRFAKYDPFHHPDPAVLRQRWRTVTCCYVLNVQPAEHLIVEILALLFHLVGPETGRPAGGQVLVAVRNDLPATSSSSRGVQLALSREQWEEHLGRFFRFELLEDREFLAWRCHQLEDPGPKQRKRRRRKP